MEALSTTTGANTVRLKRVVDSLGRCYAVEISRGGRGTQEGRISAYPNSIATGAIGFRIEPFKRSPPQFMLSCCTSTASLPTMFLQNISYPKRGAGEQEGQGDKGDKGDKEQRKNTPRKRRRSHQQITNNNQQTIKIL